jgi:hypothetical protein
MIEMRGTESDRTADPAQRRRFFIFDDRQTDLKPGDEVLVLVTRSPDEKQEQYGLALRLTEKTGASEGHLEEDEIIVEYRDKRFVAQKLPEFI